MFADPWNPSRSEVRAWAYTSGADEPCEDWDLALPWSGYERDYLDYAADPNCPNSDFFVHVLYLMVGDAVRTHFDEIPESAVRGFIDLAAASASPAVLLWRDRALRLMKEREGFNYSAWCGGGLARQKT